MAPKKLVRRPQKPSKRLQKNQESEVDKLREKSSETAIRKAMVKGTRAW